MFKKRQKKTFPPGTFIPTPARVCAIIQLCIAFTVLIWNLSEPFAGELFTYKSEQLLYQDVMGIHSSTIVEPTKHDRLNRNGERFTELTLAEKLKITAGYEQIQKKMQRTFLEKFTRALQILFFEMPLFEQAWLLFSFIIPILLLKRVEGATIIVWILPLLAILYAIDNRLYAPLPSNPQADLFPSEKILIENYLKETLNENIFIQQHQLTRAWNLYLIEEWAPKSLNLNENPANFALQSENGEFAFNVHRLMNSHLPTSKSNTQEPLLILALYIFWNSYLAFIILKYNTK